MIKQWDWSLGGTFVYFYSKISIYGETIGLPQVSGPRENTWCTFYCSMRLWLDDIYSFVAISSNVSHEYFSHTYCSMRLWSDDIYTFVA